MRVLACVGCGGLFPEVEGPTHRYLESSAGCWAAYCEVLAREYSNRSYAALHRLTVDAYAVQHPGQPSPQTIQSVAVHLISLCLMLEKGCTANQATAAMQTAAKDKSRFRWLSPPRFRGSITVLDVRKADSAAAHVEVVRTWAETSWAAWSAYHDTVEAWLPKGR